MTRYRTFASWPLFLLLQAMSKFPGRLGQQMIEVGQQMFDVDQRNSNPLYREAFS